jgi:inorganic pyrophosphatase
LKDIFEVEVIQPGRPVGQYSSKDCKSFRLDRILYPEIPLPFDVAVIPDMLTAAGEQPSVILVGEVSHPPQTQISVRILGGMQNGNSEPYLLAVPVADNSYADLKFINDLPESMRAEIIQHLAVDAIEPSWLTLKDVEPFIRASHLNFMEARAAGSKLESSRPSWQPIEHHKRTIGYTETEHYTEAEYTYFQLPYRFQYYMDNHLADDERILYAIHRPSVRTQRQRTWIGRKMLQESVLILTDQRLIHLVELIPPGTSGIRYGFEAQVGVVERLAGVEVENLNDGALLLHTHWQAVHGIQHLEWEFPQHNRSALDELATLLKNFIPGSSNPSALQRATLPVPPESLPPLHDPAANDPNDVEPINKRFSDCLTELLDPDEKAYAWALRPGWFENRGYPQILLVTDRRLWIFPDSSRGDDQKLGVSLRDITSVEYVASILRSYIRLSIMEKNHSEVLMFTFPYPAERAFRECFEKLRRCMAVSILTSD